MTSVSHRVGGTGRVEPGGGPRPPEPPRLDASGYTPDIAEAVTLRLALGAALRALPRRQCQVVAMRYLGGLTEAEVARSLGISLNSVKKHTGRAMTTLRSRIGADWQEANLALH